MVLKTSRQSLIVSRAPYSADAQPFNAVPEVFYIIYEEYVNALPLNLFL